MAHNLGRGKKAHMHVMGGWLGVKVYERVTDEERKRGRGMKWVSERTRMMETGSSPRKKSDEEYFHKHIKIVYACHWILDGIEKREEMWGDGRWWRSYS